MTNWSNQAARDAVEMAREDKTTSNISKVEARLEDQVRPLQTLAAPPQTQGVLPRQSAASGRSFFQCHMWRS